jgi:hypothetical protein
VGLDAARSISGFIAVTFTSRFRAHLVRDRTADHTRGCTTAETLIIDSCLESAETAVKAALSTSAVLLRGASLIVRASRARHFLCACAPLREPVRGQVAVIE